MSASKWAWGLGPVIVAASVLGFLNKEWDTSEPARVARSLLDLASAFGTVALPIRSFPRLPAVFSISDGKAMIALESRVARNGLKMGAQAPVVDFKEFTRIFYRAHYGSEPSADFDEKSVGSFLLVESKGENYAFFVDSDEFCVLNPADPSIYHVDFRKKYVKLKITGTIQNIVFGSNADECKSIESEFLRGHADHQGSDERAEMMRTYELLGIGRFVTSVNHDTGELEVRVVKNGRVEYRMFRVNDFIARNNIDGEFALRDFEQRISDHYSICTEKALKIARRENNAGQPFILEKRARCLQEGGFDENDQLFFEMRHTF